MAIKVGEAYVEIYPRINRALQSKVVAQIAKDYDKVFNDAYRKSALADDARVAHSAQADRDVLASRTRTERYTRNERNRTDRESEGLFRREVRRAQTSEGIFHKLATQFRTIGTVGRGLLIGSAVLGSWNLLRVAVGGVAALLPVVGAGAAVLPSALASVGAEAIILGIAFHGVGKTIKDAFNPQRQKEYNKELAHLAPAAQSFVKSIASLKGLHLPNLQQAFFGNASIQQTAKNLKEFVTVLSGSAFGVAGASGGLIGAMTKVITGPFGMSAFTSVLHSLKLNLKAATPGVSDFTKGLLTLIFHVSSFGNGKVGKAFGDFLTKVGNFAAHVDVAKVFARAKDAAHSFFTVLGDVYDIVNNIIQALNGANALKSFGDLIHTIAVFTNSPTGKIFLQELSNTLTALSTFASSVAGGALKFIANVFAGLYPSIKPFLGAASTLFHAIFTPEFGRTIGKIAQDFLDVGTHILNDVTPAVKGIVNYLTAHPKVLEGLAIGFTAIWLALRVVKGYSNIAKSIDGIRDSLQIFNPKNAEKYRGGMNTIALGLVGLAVAAFSAADAFGHGGGKGAGGKGRDAAGLVGGMALLGATIGSVVPGIGTFIGALIGAGVGALTWVASLKPVQNWFSQSLPHALGVSINHIHGWWSEVANFMMGPSIYKPFFIAGHNIVAQLDHLRNNIHRWWSGVANWFSDTVGDYVVHTFPDFFKTAGHNIAAHFDHIRGNIHSWWSSVANFFTGKVKGFFINTIPGWVGSLKHNVLVIWDNLFYWGRKKWDGFKTWVTDHFEKFFLQTIPGWAEGLRGRLLNSWKVLVDNIHFWWRKVWNTIRDTVVGIANKVFGGDGKSGLQKVWNSMFGVVGGLIKMHIADINNTPRMATGGPIRGSGGPKQDNIPIWASSGEFMVNAAATSRHRQLLEAINNGAHINYAGGGAVGAIEALQRAVGPGLRVTSTTGGGHAAHSYHYRGMAVDFAGGRRAMDVAAANLYKFSAYILELLHGDGPAGWFVKNYHKVGPGFYGKALVAQHQNHVHLAMTAQAAVQALKDLRSGKIKSSGLGFGPGGLNLPALVEQIHKSGAMKFFKPVYDLLKGVPGGKQPWKGIAKHPVDLGVTQVNKAVADMVAQAQAEAAAMASVGGAPTNLATGPHGGQIRAWIAQASRFANIPASWVQGLMYIISRESGGNPRAYNRQAVGREHASGIMQMLPSTFRAYQAHSTSRNIYDPVANIAAAVNYIHGRYGSVFNTPWLKHTGNYYARGGLIKSYDRGGVLRPGFTMAYNGTGKDEYVNKGFPEKLQVILRVDEFTKIMDTRIAKHESDIIQYIETR